MSLRTYHLCTPERSAPLKERVLPGSIFLGPTEAYLFRGSVLPAGEGPHMDIEQIKADVRWCRSSPHLVDFGGQDPRFPAESPWLDGSEGLLEQLDLSAFAKRWIEGGRHRLGAYFEALFEMWVQESPALRPIANNLQVREQKQTIGEFDFILERRGEVEHWELAIKLYLGHPGVGEGERWFGPNARDRLDLKLAKMRDHQLRLGSRDSGRRALQKLGVESAKSYGLIKGYLFDALNPIYRTNDFIYAGPQVLRGWWTHFRDREAILQRAESEGASGYLILPRLRWMAPAFSPEVIPLVHLVQDASLGQRPALLALMRWTDGVWHEVSRGFVVPDGWPQLRT